MQFPGEPPVSSGAATRRLSRSISSTYMRPLHVRYYNQTFTGSSDAKAAELAYIGVKGIKYRDRWLSWTNAAKYTGAHGRMAIDGVTVMPSGDIMEEVVGPNYVREHRWMFEGVDVEGVEVELPYWFKAEMAERSAKLLKARGEKTV